MRIVAFGISGAGDGKPLTIDRDSVLSYVSGVGRFLVSSDPAATIANSVTTPADGLLKNVIAAHGGSTFFQIRLDFPVSAGEVIYVSSSGASNIQFAFTDPS